MKAKCRWYNEGEKSKYFLNLEKGRFKNGVISSLKLGDKEIVSSEKGILSRCETFCRNIYISKTDLNGSRINDLFFGKHCIKIIEL